MAGGEIEPLHSITKPTKVRVEAREERKCGMRLDTLLSSCVQASYQASPSTQAALPSMTVGWRVLLRHFLAIKWETLWTC